MKPKTWEHLGAAGRHRDVAIALSQRPPAPAAVEWVVIVAFYSAVHYVNAYLWEIYDFDPQSHEDRSLAVHRDATLVSLAIAYDQLRGWGFSARYRPTFHASNALVQRTLDHLEQIRAAILAELRP